jgi:hypothetical protein
MGNIIIQDHTTKDYLLAQSRLRMGKHNGAFYYSKEIVDNFIPNIKTTYNWQTINHQVAPEHCIVFVHSNNALERYDYLLRYKDIILVCSTTHSMEQLKKKGHNKVILVPLSIDIEYLNKFKKEDKSGTIACGNIWAFTPEMKEYFKNNNIQHYHDLQRDDLLTLMGKAKTIYAIGRTCMEAIYLGAEVIQPDKEYPVEKYDTYYTQTDAINILQAELDKLALESFKNKKKVIIGIATKGDRNSLKQTLRSLNDQTIKADQILIYDNKKNEFNATDNGKFYRFTQPIDEDFYFFCCDDDIYYPKNYIEQSIKHINEHKCIITYHGRKLKGLDVDYYRGHKAYAFNATVPNTEIIDVCGTGVTAFDTSYFRPSKDIFFNENKRMSDLLFSLEAAEQNKTIAIIKHNHIWIKDIANDDDCCSISERKNTKQIELANEIYKLNSKK